MPNYRPVPTLQNLALKGIGAFVESLSPFLIDKVLLYHEPQQIVANLQRQLECIRQTLKTNVPFYLYDSMAVEVLKAVKKIINETKNKYRPNAPISPFLTEMTIVVSLTEVILTQSLKHIDFSKWPKIMRYILFKNLNKLTGLEELILGSCTGAWRTSDNDRFMINGFSQMSNLKILCLCFDCTDLIIQAVSENCPHVQNLDVTSSKSVTDRSVPYLLNLKKVTDLQLHQTSISIEGLAEIISTLPRLQNIGRCDEFGSVMSYLCYNLGIYCILSLRKVIARDLSRENLVMMVNVFPNLNSFSFIADGDILSMNVLTPLHNLQEFKIYCANFYSHYLNQFYESTGHQLVTIHLEQVDQMDFNVLFILGQHCPQLLNLTVYNCDFHDAYRSPMYIHRYPVEPFSKLQSLHWVVDNALSCLEFILMRGVNLQIVRLGSSTGINHVSLEKILRRNPLVNLEQLKILYSIDMSMRTVHMILKSCKNLKVLSELEGWQGIHREELRIFRDSIAVTNFDLDLRPTLSITY